MKKAGKTALQQSFELITVGQGLRTALETPELVTPQGINVLAEAENGFVAVAEVKIHQPDLLLLDIAMPLAGGAEVVLDVQRWSPASGNPIKIVDLDYWDSESEKWRSEPVPNEVINHNRSWQENRNLERVNGQSVKVRVEYKTRKWNRLLKRWGWKAGKKRFISGSKTCKRNSEFVMNVR